jgi:cobyric acid synthase
LRVEEATPTPRYADTGNLPIRQHPVENSIRLIAIGKKDYLSQFQDYYADHRAEQLAARNIHTVKQLRAADAVILRQACSVVLDRTVRVLSGIACLDLEAERQVRSEAVGKTAYSS